MEVAKIIEGLMIIQKYKPNDTSDHHFRAEHDIIYVGSLDWSMKVEDKDRLRNLGWKEDPSAGGWSTFV